MLQLNNKLNLKHHQQNVAFRLLTSFEYDFELGICQQTSFLRKNQVDKCSNYNQQFQISNNFSFLLLLVSPIEQIHFTMNSSFASVTNCHFLFRHLFIPFSHELKINFVLRHYLTDTPHSQYSDLMLG